MHEIMSFWDVTTWAELMNLTALSVAEREKTRWKCGSSLFLSLPLPFFPPCSRCGGGRKKGKLSSLSPPPARPPAHLSLSSPTWALTHTRWEKEEIKGSPSRADFALGSVFPNPLSDLSSWAKFFLALKSRKVGCISLCPENVQPEPNLRFS